VGGLIGCVPQGFYLVIGEDASPAALLGGDREAVKRVGTEPAPDAEAEEGASGFEEVIGFGVRQLVDDGVNVLGGDGWELATLQRREFFSEDA
jgi:hypothetical protein